MNTKELVIHLINEELRNQRLVTSLEDLGFDCSAFTLDISQVILELMGLQDYPDELFDKYIEWIERAMEETTYCNLKEMLDKWSLCIYERLVEEKRLSENKDTTQG